MELHGLREKWSSFVEASGSSIHLEDVMLILSVSAFLEWEGQCFYFYSTKDLNIVTRLCCFRKVLGTIFSQKYRKFLAGLLKNVTF